MAQITQHWPKWILGLAMAGCLAGCGLFSAETRKPDLPLPSDIPSVPSRDFLMDGFDEDVSAVLYAYVVLEQDRPGVGESERFASLTEAFWRGLDIRNPAGQTQLTMGYWPLAGVTLDAAKLAVEHGDWAVLAENYEHSRAQVISQRIGGLNGIGPHLVIAFQPLAQVAKPFTLGADPILVIDFSVISADKFMPLFKILRAQILDNQQMAKKRWDLPALQSAARNLLGQETENAIWLKSPLPPVSPVK